VHHLSLTNDIKTLAVIDTLRPEDLPKLSALYFVVNGGARRERFGASMNDEAVLRHCRGLDWTMFSAVGAFYSRRLEAVVELHPYDNWREAEITSLFARSLGEADLFALIQAVWNVAAAGGVEKLIAFGPKSSQFWIRYLGRLGRISSCDEMSIITIV
jgi:hypothetical protein